MPTITEVSKRTAGSVSQIAIGTTTDGSFVVTAVTGGGGLLRIIAWSIGEPSAGLIRFGDATWTASTKNVAIAGLDSNRVATAHIDGAGSLAVGAWVAGALEYGGGGGPPADPVFWFQSGQTGGSAVAVSIATLNSTEAVTAVIDGVGNLRIDAWTMPTGVMPPGGSFVLLNGSLASVGATAVAIAAVSPNQVVIAYRQSSGSGKGTLGLLVCQIEDGVVTSQGTGSGGAISELALTSGGTKSRTAYAATITEKGALEFSLWTVLLTGDLSAPVTVKGFPASQVAVCAPRAGSDNLVVAATIGASGTLEFQVWDNGAFDGVYTLTTGAPIHANKVAAAIQADGYFVTATRGSKPEDLAVQAWSIAPAAKKPNGPGGNPGSYANYILCAAGVSSGSSSCPPLIGVEVTIKIDKPLAAGSSGYSFQLNANSAGKGNPQIVWQQYIIVVVGNNLLLGINNWTYSNQLLINPVGTAPVPLPSAPVPTIPAGYTLTIALKTDAKNNVDGVTFTVIDDKGNKSVTRIQPFTLVTGAPAIEANLAPIVAFELDIVGPGNGNPATFISGAGTISYSASTTLTALDQIPPCAASTVSSGPSTTGETSNSVYGILPAGSSKTFIQNFTVR